tara:strand:- start:542 stop:1147 length:606 start_codon:yes stop_codon:yes gene_type:complete
MAIRVEPEMGVKLENSPLPIDLKDRVEAAANTAEELEIHGLSLELTQEDKDVTAKLSTAYSGDPETTSKKVTNKKLSTVTPASIVMTNNILKEFGRSVVESSKQIRDLVTNKLLIESENPDPRVRIRALELLGKISDVGLFSEKSEITVTHQSTDDLRERLREKLTKLVNPEEEIEDAVLIDGESIDVDEELGLKDKNDDN